IHVVAVRPEQPRLLPVSGHAVTAQISEVRAKRRGARAMAHHAGLDDDDARAAGQEAIGLNAGALAAPEARAVARRDLAGTGDAAPGLLRGGERLRNERPSLLCASRADAPRPDANFAVIGHGAAPHGAKGTGKSGRWARSARCAKAQH